MAGIAALLSREDCYVAGESDWESLMGTTTYRILWSAIAAVAAIVGACTYAHAGTSLPGDILISDRGAGRLLVVNPEGRIVWSMVLTWPSQGGAHSKWADDAFVTPDHHHIVFNEEDNQAIDIVDIATRKIVWSYGHPGVKGRGPGYLNTPDDAIQMPDGNIVVSDIANQRILFIDPKTGSVTKQYGATKVRRHAPPQSFNAPDGAYPTPDGGLLVTEIGWSKHSVGYLDRLSASGSLLYSVKTDLIYPSDGNVMPDGNILVVDFVHPGAVEIVAPTGKVLWRYRKDAGSDALDHPSNAVPLPNGNILVCDDWNNRIVVIDPRSNSIVWQYGHQGIPGSDPGYLNVPDEVVFVPPSWELSWSTQAANSP